LTNQIKGLDRKLKEHWDWYGGELVAGDVTI
jgi:hypothetical protein